MKKDQIWQVVHRLKARYGSPRLGNQRNPLDELIFITLSTRSQPRSYVRTYAELKKAFPIWDRIRARHENRIEVILRPNGLSRLKARQIVRIIMRLRQEFRRATLAPLRAMTDRDAERFLLQLPGVSLKIAKCVLMYSLDRQVLPVDVHTHRIAQRLGIETKQRPDTSQSLIERAIPPSARYDFHVNAIMLGRSVCLPTNPRCQHCCISTSCRYYHQRYKVRGEK